MATSLARGFYQQGKLAAFGDGKTIRWTEYCDDVFANNPNIAHPGMEKQKNVVWFPHYKTIYYATYKSGRWVWDLNYRAMPGEFFFSPLERLPFRPAQSFIVIEPNVAWQRTVSINKDWGDGKYEQVAKALMERGHTIVQFVHKNSRRLIDGAIRLPTKTFRAAAAIMSDAALFIGPEGANHHAAAAVGIPAVVVWGGYSPPETMGYKTHINLTGGVEACGNTSPCKHCLEAMQNISIDDVVQAACKNMKPISCKTEMN